VEKGVKFSDTAFNFLVSKGLINGPKRKVKLPKKVEAPVVEEKPVENKAEEVKKEEVKPVAEEKKPEVKEAIKVEETAKSEAKVDKK
jgi:hypothetical protein